MSCSTTTCRSTCNSNTPGRGPNATGESLSLWRCETLSSRTVRYSRVSDLTFSTHLGLINRRLQVDRMEYHAGAADVVLSRANQSGHRKRPEYDLQATVNNDPDYLKRGTPGRAWKLPPPVKCYGFPGETFAYFSNSDFVSVLELDLERQFNDRLFYLGPLRQFPARQYPWQGSTPSDVGVAGERTIEALLSSRGRDPVRTNARKYDKRGYAIRRISVEQHVAEWLKELNLVDDFDVEQISPGIDLYQVMVRRQTESTRVTLADVGFGVSQVLPVLALLAYVPEGSTVLLEQPELHLHPAVQSGLADVILEAAKIRKVQVIVESHSEHLLLRLQRRVAEGRADPNDVSLYFCNLKGGRSHLQRLSVNHLGEIEDWPDGFFGDPLGEGGGHRGCPQQTLRIQSRVKYQVIDSNVLAVANGHSPQAGPACRRATVEALQNVELSRLVLDEGQEIIKEYRNQVNLTTQLDYGDRFYLKILQVGGYKRVKLDSHPGRSYVAFPADPRLDHFDSDDRKFVAAAIVAGKERTRIYNAVDPGYLRHEQALRDVGVNVLELCPVEAGGSRQNR